MEARLTVVGGKSNKDAVALRLPTTIGRSRKAGITVAHPMISRQHCELSESGGLILLRDLGSLNGTLVSGQKVEETVLKPHDEFTIGPLTFRVEYEYEGDLSDVPQPTLAEEPEEPAEVELDIPDFAAAEPEEAVEAIAEPAADEVAQHEASVFADVEETPLVPEGEKPALVAPEEEEPAASLPAAAPVEQGTEEEIEEIDAFDEALREVTTTEAVEADAPPAAPAEPASGIVLRPEPEAQPVAEEEPGPVDLDAIEEVPDLSFMDDEFPVAVEEDELPVAMEEDDLVEVEAVDEEEPEPSSPPGLSAPEAPPAAARPEPPQVPTPPQAPAAAQTPAAGEPDFSALSQADDESEPEEASDAALNDFLKGLR